MVRHYYLLLIIILTATSAAISTAGASAPCNSDDRKVLFKIKKALGDPYVLASWSPDTDCCHWYVAKCNRTTGRITKLLFISGELAGRIPPEVGELPYLEELWFHKYPNLTGAIPSTIAGLQHLRFLVLTWNNLTGPIPAFLAAIKTLEFLELSFNSFSGSIPPELASLPSLRSLRLDRNRLSGSIPSTFGGFGPSIYTLDLSHNQLTGGIPSSFSDVNFSVIDLSRNRLSGSALALFSGAKSGLQIDISRNQFEFDFSEAGFPQGLISLDVNHNKIFGGLAESITKVELHPLATTGCAGQFRKGGGCRRWTQLEGKQNFPLEA